MRRLVVFSVASILAFSVAAFAQGTYKGQAAQGLPGGDVPQAIQSGLQPQGESVLDSSGKIVCEVWLRKDLAPASSPDAASNVLYGKIAQGSLVGVIHFPDAAKDFRGQGIKAGYYTLRYELVPEDGNHMGVSQYRDFLLLVPAAKDTDGDKAVTFNDALKLSRESTDTGHPGVMLMDSVSDTEKTFPAVFQDYSQNWALQMESQLGNGGSKLPLAIVLVGQYQG
ncbi:MAG: hypothetical protein EPN47_14395 [Acidobacteria bacterium]|nr:MAG: hypothetical protein EPN47_14395 [Acidobacteriota bacterium]